MALELGYKGRRSSNTDMTFGEDFKSDSSLLSQVMSKSKENLTKEVPASTTQLAEAELADEYRQRRGVMGDGELLDPILAREQGGGDVSLSQGGGSFSPNASSNGKGFTIYDNGKYNSYTKLSGNKAFRNNNPGNISGMSGNLLYGASGFARNSHGDAGDRAQLVFNTPQQGYKAMYQLMSGKNYNNAPISKAFSKYQSNQVAWKNMQNAMVKNGINPRTSTFNQLSPQQKVWFMNSRAAHEGYTGQRVTWDMLG